ncbi:MAG: exodeoxyribonuclease III [Rickettsiales bacterium]
MLKVSSWNVNSVKSRILNVLEWVKQENPDIILLQETKCINENFPKEQFEDLGFNVAVHGQKTFNGVAILSKYPLEDIQTQFPDIPNNEQARYIEAVANVNGKVIRVASVYVPNGQDLSSDKYEYKKKFFAALNSHYQKLLSYDEPLLLGGDFNVALENIDTYSIKEWEDTVLFHREIRKIMNDFLNIGMADLFRLQNPGEHQYSWWDYRGGAWQKNKGLRIDYLLGSPEVIDILQNCEINADTRGKEKPSDHAPVTCELSL